MQELAALFLLGLLEPGPPGEHHVVPVAVELDDLGLDGPTDIGLELAYPAQLHQRRRQEAPEADVHDQPALDHLDHRAGDHLVGLLELLDGAPGPLVLRPLLREDQAALLVLLLEDQGFDGLAQGHDLRRIDVIADRELAHRDDTLGFESDVEEHLVPVDLDHRSLDQVTVLELDDGSGHGILEGCAAEVVLGDRNGEVDTVLIEAAHGFGGQQGGALGYDVGIGHELGCSLSGRVPRDPIGSASGEGEATPMWPAGNVTPPTSPPMPSRRAAQPPLASAQEEPQAMATFKGTDRSAAPDQRLFGEVGHLVGLVGLHVDQHLVVDLEHQL